MPGAFEAVIVWIIENQLGRRNLPDAERIEYALQLEPAEAALSKVRQVAAANQTNAQLGRAHQETVPPNSAEPSKGETRDKLSGKAGVGHTKFNGGSPAAG